MFAVFLLPMEAAAAQNPPGVVIDHHPAPTQQYIGSPSIAIAPSGAYVASHDFFGKGSTQSTSAVSRVFRSHDRGRSWTKTAEFSDQFCGSTGWASVAAWEGFKEWWVRFFRFVGEEGGVTDEPRMGGCAAHPR